MRFVLLGIDEGFNREKPGYADTVLLVSASFLRCRTVMMSIPRDLQMPIEELGEDRLGAVYRAAELKEAGAGPGAVTSAVSKSFQIPITYYVSVNMDGFVRLVDLLGGLDITLDYPVAHCPAGLVHLNGQAAIAFARDRANTDDFARMYQAHILIRAMLAQVRMATLWSKLPRFLYALAGAVDTNLPIWEWPLLASMVFSSRPNRIATHAITRDMVFPRITSQGESVIEPNWHQIHAMTKTILGERR